MNHFYGVVRCGVLRFGVDLNTSYVTGLLRGLSTPTRERPFTLMAWHGAERYGLPRSGAVWNFNSQFRSGGVRCSVAGHGVESNFIGGIL